MHLLMCYTFVGNVGKSINDFFKALLALEDFCINVMKLL